MLSVLISVQPKWCALIASGVKPLEIRKNKPNLQTPFKCYLYCTKPGTTNPNEILETHSVDGKIRKCNGMVMGEFLCDGIVPIRVFNNGNIQFWNFYDLSRSCLSYEELANYIGSGKTGYGWHISDLVIYDKPKRLSEFHKPGYLEAKNGVYGRALEEEKSWQITRAPQSWCYVEDLWEEEDYG